MTKNNEVLNQKKKNKDITYYNFSQEVERNKFYLD